jgi:hypothetical protein
MSRAAGSAHLPANAGIYRSGCTIPDRQKVRAVHFGLSDCDPAGSPAYLLKSETPPGDVEYRMEAYGAYRVYIPVERYPAERD